jgi:hypothetical protein
MTSPRFYEVNKLQVGQEITTSGYPGHVIRLYNDGPYEAARMYEVRLRSGDCCVCGSDILPVVEA